MCGLVNNGHPLADPSNDNCQININQTMASLCIKKAKVQDSGVHGTMNQSSTGVGRGQGKMNQSPGRG